MTERICTIEDCEEPHYGRGWCMGHYSRWRRYGSPTAGRPSRVKAYDPDAVCAVDDCDERPGSRGWCRNHYYRWKKYGSPTAGPPLARQGRTLEERFWSKVNKNGPVPAHRPDLGRCWVWTKGKTRGYGVIGVNGTSVRAHVLAYQWLVGPVPERLELDHLCRNPSCVRPEHLEAVTHQVNLLRGAGPSARNAAKTHCSSGHAFDEENTRIDGRGTRHCRACNREQLRQAHGYYKP